MRTPLRISLFTLWGIAFSITGYSQLGRNFRPIIIGQKSLSTYQATPITLQLTDFSVLDLDNPYPNGFTLKVFKGKNYSVSGTTVIPDPSFVGTLTVEVTVDDGRDESRKFDAKITVIARTNVPPVIVDQEPLSTEQGTPITLQFSHLKVEDPDNEYPIGFSIKISSGANYSVSGTTITPSQNFTGELTVPVRVNDGKDDSDPFNLKITVTPSNVAPVITGQVALSTPHNTPITILLTHLQVTDPDNKYPDDFTLQVLAGSNYTFSGHIVTPASGFAGTLNVNVRVNDGIANSPTFGLKIQVAPANVPPVITGQVPLSILEDHSITIELTHLTVSDPDNVYPNDFTLSVLPRVNYTVSKNVVTPAQDFNGNLIVRVAVSDGKAFSEPYNLIIFVQPVNDPPLITNLETHPLKYDRGIGPVYISKEVTIIDVDDDSLSIAEIGFRPDSYRIGNDVLVLNNDSLNIATVFDAQRGALFLIGKASVKDFQAAFRSVQYNYVISESPFEEEMKTFYMHISDGKAQSEIRERDIEMVPHITLHIPNAFTPNGDTANDRWVVRPLNSSESFSEAIIRVYNARGSLVYEATGLDNEWDGIYLGEVLPSDTYYYTIDLNLSYSTSPYRGAVTILR